MANEKKPPVEVNYDDVQVPKKQRTPFKRTRAGIELTRDEVKEIKEGRKKLRRDLKEAGIKDKKEFELTATSMMLYFDKPKFLAIIPWLFGGRGLWLLLGALGLLLLTLLAMSMVTELRGHFTINLSDGMFKEGFSLSETVSFESPTMRLFAEPAEDIIPVSITDIREDVPMTDGRATAEHQYFAYTFYIRNEGESTVDYTWQLRFNSETQNLSDAMWAMVFEDDEMRFYAEVREDGTQEALPYFDDDSRGYTQCPLLDWAKFPEDQYQLIRETETKSFYRLVPFAFESEEIITSGIQKEVAPMDVHKYTVVIWLEGDDPDCTNDKIGGYAGVEMHFKLEGEEGDGNSFDNQWNDFWN
ncbi:MAG: hypothetical protein E7447_02140 [Ruminococcaceae bacterium]|nr:hypothetical protein [Oscillospiraceae bacterium]